MFVDRFSFSSLRGSLWRPPFGWGGPGSAVGDPGSVLIDPCSDLGARNWDDATPLAARQNSRIRTRVQSFGNAGGPLVHAGPDYLKYIYALEMAQRHTNKLGTNMTAHNITAHNILSHTRFCATKYCAPLSELHFHIIVGVVFRPLTQLQPRLLLLLLLAGILPRPALPTTARPTAARPTAARSIAVDLAVCGGV